MFTPTWFRGCVYRFRRGRKCDRVFLGYDPYIDSPLSKNRLSRLHREKSGSIIDTMSVWGGFSRPVKNFHLNNAVHHLKRLMVLAKKRQLKVSIHRRVLDFVSEHTSRSEDRKALVADSNFLAIKMGITDKSHGDIFGALRPITPAIPSGGNSKRHHRHLDRRHSTGDEATAATTTAASASGIIKTDLSRFELDVFKLSGKEETGHTATTAGIARFLMLYGVKLLPNSEIEQFFGEEAGLQFDRHGCRGNRIFDTFRVLTASHHTHSVYLSQKMRRVTPRLDNVIEGMDMRQHLIRWPDHIVRVKRGIYYNRQKRLFLKSIRPDKDISLFLRDVVFATLLPSSVKGVAPIRGVNVGYMCALSENMGETLGCYLHHFSSLSNRREEERELGRCRREDEEDKMPPLIHDDTRPIQGREFFNSRREAAFLSNYQYVVAEMVNIVERLLSQGFVCLDLKPDNIVLDNRDCRPYLIDLELMAVTGHKLHPFNIVASSALRVSTVDRQKQQHSSPYPQTPPEFINNAACTSESAAYGLAYLLKRTVMGLDHNIALPLLSNLKFCRWVRCNSDSDQHKRSADMEKLIEWIMDSYCREFNNEDYRRILTDKFIE